jgi:serine phosphatase RsbU (regulator of sigma subunit)
MSRARISIRAKLLAAFLAVLVPMVILQASTLRRWTAEREAAVLTAEAEAADAAAADLREYFSDLARAAAAFPVDPLGGRLVFSPADVARYQMLHRSLFTSAFLAYPDGRVVPLSGAAPAPIARELPPFLHLLQQGRDTAISGVLTWNQTSHPYIMAVSSRRTPDGGLVGAVVLTADIQLIPNAINASLPHGAVLVITDRRGDLVVDSRRPNHVPTSRISLRAHPLIAAAMQHGAVRAREFVSPVDGISYLGAAVREPESGWVVSAQVRFSSAMAPVRAAAWHSFLWLAAVAVGVSLLAFVAATGVTGPIRSLAGAAQRIGEGQLGARARIGANDEIRDLAHTFNTMAARVEETVADLQHVQQELRDAYDRERRVSMMLQRDLLPKAPPAVPGLDVGHLYRASSTDSIVGGDFYDFLPLPDEGVLVVVADISGTGLEAASALATLKDALHFCAIEEVDPALLLTRINRLLCSTSAQDSFVTMACAAIKPERNSVLYASAGHEPPLLIRAGTRRAEFLLLDTKALPLGIDPDEAYEAMEVPFRSGDILVVYTDGVTDDHRTSDDTVLGQVGAVVAQQDECVSAQHLAARLYDEAVAAAGGQLRDDTAIVVVRHVGKPCVTAHQLVQAPRSAAALSKRTGADPDARCGSTAAP